jgi:tetratricopeptide (TPR) repeat protein
MGSASATARSQHSSRAIDPRAREEYLKARNFWKQRTAEALTQAVDHYNLALELDPNYAEAYAGLANCYVVMPLMSTVRMEDSYLRASQATEKALALDDSLAEAHLAAAEIKFYSDWNFPGAEIEFRRSLELDSTDPQAHQWYAEFLSLMGRHPEAIAQIQTAQQLDPSSMIIHHQAGQIYQSARMYPEALLAYRRALMIEPGFGPTYSAMALAYRRQGLYAECLEAERHANPYWDPDGTNLKDLKRVADAYAANGKQGFLRASLTFNKKHPGAAYFFAHDYALLGENDEALKWLQQALASHRPEVLNLQNDPEFDHLRADPRFQEIAKKVGIPQPARAESAGRGGSS